MASRDLSPTDPRQAETDDAREMSFDAKVVAGACFGILMKTLVFQMRESRPTARTQAALDELVRRGDLTREIINGRGGVKYTATRQFADEYAFVGGQEREAVTFRITEPLEAGR